MRQAFSQRLEPAPAGVFIRVGRVHHAAVLGGHVNLRAEKRSHRRVAHLDAEIHHRLPRLVGKQALDQARRRRADQPQQTSRPEVPPDDPPGVGRLDAGVKRGLPIRADDLDKRRLVAHADAADTLDAHRRSACRQGVLERLLDLGAAPGLAARAQADADLAQRAAVGGQSDAPGAPGAGGLAMREVGQHLLDTLAGQMPVGHVVDPRHGRQRAAAHAGDALDGVAPARVGVATGGDLQVLPERIEHALRPLDVAGRADAHMHQVLADGRVAELVVERRDARYVGGGDLADLADPLQRLGRQVAVVHLDRLEDRYKPLAGGPDAGDRLVNVCQIDVGHFSNGNF